MSLTGFVINALIGILIADHYKRDRLKYALGAGVGGFFNAWLYAHLTGKNWSRAEAVLALLAFWGALVVLVIFGVVIAASGHREVF